ncbi:MAG: RluA family pseudouridine synthase [Candidatus Kaiserbacteria bacterium]|nr:RluA family pseudouridine synthase [Candidatus Kaiserbacteria bacterium]
MELPILYEDADLVAVAKPAGLITHSDGRTKEETAEEWFLGKYKVEITDPPSSGYVHRLDRDTSGVLVFAKHAIAYSFLRKAFHDRDVKKEYLAFVYGAPKEKKGTIDFDIGRSRSDFRLRSAQPKAKGLLRDARTHFEVLAETAGYALLRMTPETGRTHQIRVHLKAIHHPIVGDVLYAPNHPAALGIKRLGLHAYALDIPLPSGERTRILAPVPDDLAPAFAHFPGAAVALDASA